MIEASDASFKADVLDSTMPVLVDFWAEWCGPCRMLGPKVESLAGDFEGKIKVVKINIDQNTETPQKFGVRGIPTLMFFKEGQLISTKVGDLPKSTLYDWINSLL